MAKIFVFPLSRQKRLDVVKTVHAWAAQDVAIRAGTWKRFSDRTKASLTRRGVPIEAVEAAIQEYRDAFRSAAESLGYVERDNLQNNTDVNATGKEPIMQQQKLSKDEAIRLLQQAGYFVRQYRFRYLITNDRGMPVHATDRPDRNPYTESLEDLRFWVTELCEDEFEAAS